MKSLNVISKKFAKVRSTLTLKAAAIMLKHTDDRFREQGWKDASLTPWQKRKNDRSSRAILIKSGALRRGNRRISVTETTATVGNDVVYAKAHNDGFHGSVTVKAHTRKRLARTRISMTTQTGKQRKVNALKPIGDIQVRSFSRNMNLPQRKFMGRSSVLSKNIVAMINKEVRSCFK